MQECKFDHPTHKQGAGISRKKKEGIVAATCAAAEPTPIHAWKGFGRIAEATMRNLNTCSEGCPETSFPNATGIVCRHWKNRGWCKYQGACKFAHPERKQGVGTREYIPTLADNSLCRRVLDE
jgi:hypothetical protein